MALLRGKGLGLEIVLAGRNLDEALTELESRLLERPGFYRGTPAVAVFGNSQPTEAELSRLRALLDDGGIGLEALSGGPHLETLAAAFSLRYVSTGTQADAGDEFARRRAMRPQRKLQLSDSARSLVADFAGARSDIAERRKRGDTSVRRLTLDEPAAAGKTEGTPAASAPGAVAAPPATLYHTGTLRGGQSLHNAGNIVVIGDVNPGAELVATGDVVVFGALRGVAHAGAQGDESARVYAIELAPTQLRIATYIAAENGSTKNRPACAEAACVENNRIVVLPLDRIDQIPREGLH
jgi:septum site-determining protein MinC